LRNAMRGEDGPLHRGFEKRLNSCKTDWLIGSGGQNEHHFPSGHSRWVQGKPSSSGGKGDWPEKTRSGRLARRKCWTWRQAGRFPNAEKTFRSWCGKKGGRVKGKERPGGHAIQVRQKMDGAANPLQAGRRCKTAKTLTQPKRESENHWGQDLDPSVSLERPHWMLPASLGDRIPNGQPHVRIPGPYKENIITRSKLALNR